jgi:excisionase family DNA binding protein
MTATLTPSLAVEALRGRIFCTVPEAAELLEVDPRTLRRAIDAGEFPAVKISGSVRIPVAKLLALAGVDPEPATDHPGAPAAPTVLDGATSGTRT